ncbi:hypothetical protein IEO70_16415 [Bacillus sp. AGMB 02131]|uniref:Uncharacterized protein n=1 Tax=Peribacillus faecalis TaxID=2772559 RepID=A0A927CZF7_9BACI|nr:hypothetical protein [Peribacillus faecalis]MBD3109924.1 hypothetical protein [Peribacillus faecalis]
MRNLVNLIMYLIIGTVPGFILAGKLGILIGIGCALLLCIIDQLTLINEKLTELKAENR